MNDILYIALELTKNSHNTLFEFLLDHINELPDDFRPKIICHHSTLVFHHDLNQEIVDYAYKNEGKLFPIRVVGIGMSDKAIAVKCEYDAPCYVNVKHITLAVNTTVGGKSVDSNNIEYWNDIQPIDLLGRLCIYYKNRR